MEEQGWRGGGRGEEEGEGGSDNNDRVDWRDEKTR